MGYRYGYKVHPVAELFPVMPREEFERLKRDIKENGQIEPIMLDYAGEMLLDGRHRLKACKELGVEPRVLKHSTVGLSIPLSEFTAGPGWHCDRFSDADFIWAKNVLRRHLTDDQRAVLVNEFADATREAAKQRQRQNLRQGDKNPEVMDSSPRGKTRGALAKKAGVSTHKIQQVETVTKHKSELLPKVKSGEVKLKDAVKMAHPSAQDKLLLAIEAVLEGGTGVIDAAAKFGVKTEEILKEMSPGNTAYTAQDGQETSPPFHEEGVLAKLDNEIRKAVDKLWPKNKNLSPVVRTLRNYADYLKEVQESRKD
ncbi:MAG: ParB N-terminal domain-containing protein [Candidatus Sulfotelmatobacter sp.]